MPINRFQAALALTRRLDRLDPDTRAVAESIVDAIESGRPHASLLRTFFPSAWARCGRSAADASTPADRRQALAHLAVLSELESVLGLAPATESEQAAVEVPVSSEHEPVPGPAPVSSPESQWSAP